MNAKALVDAGAALMVGNADLNGEGLSRLLREMKEDPERRKRMGERAAALAQPGAAEKIADLCYRMVENE